MTKPDRRLSRAKPAIMWRQLTMDGGGTQHRCGSGLAGRRDAGGARARGAGPRARARGAGAGGAGARGAGARGARACGGGARRGGRACGGGARRGGRTRRRRARRGGAGRRTEVGKLPPDASDGVSAERSDTETCFRLDSPDDPLSSLPPVAFPTANAPAKASSAATPSDLGTPGSHLLAAHFPDIRAPCSWQCWRLGPPARHL